MGQVLHGCARTTEAVRRAIQHGQESLRALARRHGVNPKTVAKWRKRTTTADAPMGPTRPRSTTLTEAEEAIVVEFRRRTLLPLDDVLGCLRVAVPALIRSALNRCPVRHGISRLPRDADKASKRKRFAETARPSRRSTASPASSLPRNSQITLWTKPGSSGAGASIYLQSILAWAASAARLSLSLSRNWSSVTRARRHGA